MPSDFTGFRVNTILCIIRESMTLHGNPMKTSFKKKYNPS